MRRLWAPARADALRPAAVAAPERVGPSRYPTPDGQRVRAAEGEWRTYLRGIQPSLADWLSLLGLALVPLILFRQEVLGKTIIVGNLDRPSSFLNVLTYHLDTLHTGGIQAWTDAMFMGMNTYALPYTFPNVTNLIAAAFPRVDIDVVSGYVSCALLVFAGWAAYAFIKDVSAHAFSAFIGSALYELSTFSTLKVDQNDMSFAVIIHLPLALLALRRLKASNVLLILVALTAVLASLFYFTFLQKVAYGMMLVCGYAAFRSLVTRSWQPVIVLGMAMVSAVVIALPRLVTVAQEFGLLRRTLPGQDHWTFETLYEFQNILPIHSLRWFQDDIFGRLPSEAGPLVNNINLTEGMLLYTSTFTPFVVLVGVGLFVRQWLRGRRSRPSPLTLEVGFYVAAMLVVFGVLTIRPAVRLLYILFQGADFTHARIVVAGLLPLCALVALSLREVLGQRAAAPAPRRTAMLALLGVGLVFAAAIVGTLTFYSQSVQRLGLGLDEPSWYIQETVGRLMFEGRGIQDIPPPQGLTAKAVSPSQIQLDWQRVPGATEYRLGYKLPLWDVFRELPFVPGAAPQYDAVGLGPSTPYGFAVQACNPDRCSDYSAEVWTTTFLEGTNVELRAQPPPPPTMHLLSTALVYWLWALVIAAALLVALWISHRWWPLRTVLALTFAFILLFDAFWHADFRVNALADQSKLTNLSTGDIVQTDPATFQPPEAAALNQFRSRLDTDDYRSIVLCNPTVVPVFCAPHLAFFWQLRLVDGYSAGIPSRLAALPWTTDVLSLRTLTFSNPATLPWPLLSLLNVRQAIAVDPALYLNSSPGGPSKGIDPGAVELLQNPLPVVPRQFFAAHLASAANMSEAVDRLFPEGPKSNPIDVTDTSVVEGLTPPAQPLSSDGAIDANYHGDDVDITVTPSGSPRFLVLNELYHPSWRGWVDGQETKIYATNAVMRGLVVPAGATHIVLHFSPFFDARTMLICLVVGLILLSVMGLFLRRRWRSSAAAGL